MKHLLVVAHGSRRQESNTEIGLLAQRLSMTNSLFASVSHAFLEIAEPSIPDALRQLIRSGAEQIVVLPYFLSAGRHVATDIPEQILQVQTESSAVEILLAPYLGASAEMDGLVMRQALLGLAEGKEGSSGTNKPD